MAVGDTVSFETVNIPSEVDGIPVGDNEETSDDLVCQYPGCFQPLTYGGRGRKPKYCDEHKSTRSTGTATRKTSADVELAVQTLHGLYEGLGFPLALVSHPSAEVWEGQIPGLDERNRLFLATNKDLVKKINSMANKGGNFAFVFSHIIAIAPVVAVLRADLAQRRAERLAQAPEETAEDYTQAGGF